ncbi:ATP-dependent Lon protease pim [Salix suchowensis]|nr:ATP-dependent Lon protease pim [Salix suchowensis]
MMKRGQPYLGAFLLKTKTRTRILSRTSIRRIKITDLAKAGQGARIEEVDEAEPQTVEPPATPKSEPITGMVSVVASQYPVLTFLVFLGPVQTSFLHKHAISIVDVENLYTQPYNKDDQYIRAFMSEIVSVFKDIAQLNPLFRDQITNFSINQVASNVFDEPDKLADFAAAVSTGEVQELQDVLESLVVDDRLRKALLVLKKELIKLNCKANLVGMLTARSLSGNATEGYQEGAGHGERWEGQVIEKFKERAAGLKMPEAARKVFDEELNKLAGLEPAASEANNYSISHAQTVLDADHYGLTDVKSRILEFLAVGKLRGTVQGKIICLVGPPGVGKTSIGKSIARALGRQFFRFSVGGLTDVAEIKGHRRTYVGSVPLVLYSDTKLTHWSGHNGDPASALLEMLDPEQNNNFLDHYQQSRYNPAPLLDRMEVLEVSGYVSEEKSVIAEKYLGPQAREASGLHEADVVLDSEAIDVLIKYYCRESGVRNLKKHIDKIYRKAALKIVQDLGEDVFPEPAVPSTEATTDEKDAQVASVESQEPPTGEFAPASTPTDIPSPLHAERKTVTTQERQPMKVPETVHIAITPETLKDYVGPPVYQKDRMYSTPPPPGVSTGLGYLGNGSGAVMPVEAMSMPGKGGLQLTGKLGEVIRESAQLGLSWVKGHAYQLGITTSPDEQFLNDKDIHVHMPEGSIGKEGPSAGTAILSAFVSLFTKTKINPDIVGGLKEKILAAHRAGIKTIIAPAANRADIEENVPESVKTGIRFVYVEDVREVLNEVFRGEPIAERWKDTNL